MSFTIKGSFKPITGAFKQRDIPVLIQQISSVNLIQTLYNPNAGGTSGYEVQAYYGTVVASTDTYIATASPRMHTWDVYGGRIWVYNAAGTLLWTLDAPRDGNFDQGEFGTKILIVGDYLIARGSYSSGSFSIAVYDIPSQTHLYTLHETGAFGFDFTSDGTYLVVSNPSYDSNRGAWWSYTIADGALVENKIFTDNYGFRGGQIQIRGNYLYSMGMGTGANSSRPNFEIFSFNNGVTGSVVYSLNGPGDLEQNMQVFDIDGDKIAFTVTASSGVNRQIHIRTINADGYTLGNVEAQMYYGNANSWWQPMIKGNYVYWTSSNTVYAWDWVSNPSGGTTTTAGTNTGVSLPNDRDSGSALYYDNKLSKNSTDIFVGTTQGGTNNSGRIVTLNYFDNTTPMTYNVFSEHPPTDRYFGDYFGVQVSTDGNNYAVGSYSEGIGSRTNVGVVYLYDSNYNLIQTLRPDNIDAESRFGYAISMRKGILAVSAYSEWYMDEVGFNYGKVYLYNAATGDLLRVIKNPNLGTVSTDDSFGRTIDLSPDGKYLVVTAHQDDGAETIADNGSMYIFDTATGNVLSSQMLPSPSATASWGSEDRELSVSNEYIALSSYSWDQDGFLDTGICIVYDITTGNEVRRIDITDSGGSASNYVRYGYSTAVTGDYVAVSQWQSTNVHVYSISTGTLLYTISANTTYPNLWAYGTDLAISFQDTDVKIYDITTGTERFTINQPGSFISFGYNLDICNGSVIVGAYVDESQTALPEYGSGSAWIYK